jgi:hypothetical protein
MTFRIRRATDKYFDALYSCYKEVTYTRAVKLLKVQ